MRNAARQPAEDPDPEPPRDLPAEAAALIDRAAAALAAIEGDPLNDRAVSELALVGIRLSAFTGALQADTARRSAAKIIWDAAWAACEARAAAAARVPAQHRRTRRPIPGQLALVKMKGAALPAIAAAAAALRRVAKVTGHAPVHGAGIKLTAAKAATVSAAGLGAAGLAITGAVVIHSATSPGGSYHGQGANPAASAYAAVRAPSVSPAAMTRPKPKHAPKGKRLLSVTGLPLPSYGSAPDPSSSSAPSSSAPSVQASVQAGPAVLTVSTTALDLTSLTSETITLSATGAGWVSWKVALPADPLTQATQTDLDFSATHGVLQAGESTTITVSLDPSQLLDGNLSETFTIGGVSVRATLPPLPVPVPSVLPSALPSVLPSI